MNSCNKVINNSRIFDYQLNETTMKTYTLLTPEELKAITKLNDMSIKITTKATFKRAEKKYPLKVNRP